MIAFKTWLQAPSNPDSVPTEWPWVEEFCTEEQIPAKLAAGFQVLTEEAFAAYKDARDEEFQAWYDSAPQVAKRAQASRNILIQARLDYSKDLMKRFKEKNISEGINAPQAMWMHHRMRAMDVTFNNQTPYITGLGLNGMTFTIDILNLAISGDIEVACLSLMASVPDDMTEGKHWLSAARISWLINDMKSFLGWA